MNLSKDLEKELIAKLLIFYSRNKYIYYIGFFENTYDIMIDSLLDYYKTYLAENRILNKDISFKYMNKFKFEFKDFGMEEQELDITIIGELSLCGIINRALTQMSVYANCNYYYKSPKMINKMNNFKDNLVKLLTKTIYMPYISPNNDNIIEYMHKAKNSIRDDVIDDYSKYKDITDILFDLLKHIIKDDFICLNHEYYIKQIHKTYKNFYRLTSNHNWRNEDCINDISELLDDYINVDNLHLINSFTSVIDYRLLDIKLSNETSIKFIMNLPLNFILSNDKYDEFKKTKLLNHYSDAIKQAYKLINCDYEIYNI